MNIFKQLRFLFRRSLRDFSIWYIKRYGYCVIEEKNIYDWQIHPNYNASYNLPTKIPKEAIEYLQPKNSRLVQLKNDYQKFLANNFKKGLWTEDYLKNDDLLFFRGDNPYVHQKRGNQLKKSLICKLIRQENYLAFVAWHLLYCRKKTNI